MRTIMIVDAVFFVRCGEATRNTAKKEVFGPIDTSCMRCGTMQNRWNCGLPLCPHSIRFAGNEKSFDPHFNESPAHILPAYNSCMASRYVTTPARFGNKVRINVDPVASFQLLEHGACKKIRLVRSSHSTSTTISRFVCALHSADNVRFHSIQMRSQQRQRQHTQRRPLVHTHVPNKFYMHSALGCI